VTVNLEIPEELAHRLAPDDVTLARAALEALAAGGVRSGKLTPFQARCLLGIESPVDMDGILKAHGVLLDVTIQDVCKDADVVLAVCR
jgi:Uncharacterised protein family (UPF0175)